MYTLIIYLYSFILGMCMASFFMLVGYRIPRKETIMGRSHCENCESELKWWQVIPVVSYIFLKGECKECRAKIGTINPISEFSIGILFISNAYFLGLTQEVLVSFTFICLLFTISISDYIYQIIPNKVLLPFFVLGLLERGFIPQNNWWYPLVGALAGFLPLFLIGLLNEKSIGGGDIKLFGVIGVYIGPIGVLISLFLSSAIGIIVYVVSFIRTGNKKKYIPFGPSIALASYIVYLFTSGQAATILNVFTKK
ncbi:prepilin peptidase [Enterococcus faecalis]|nr:prepilin peptidase [Enterococcus faecalis]